MKGMFAPVLRTIYKKKEAKICLLFSAFPMLLILTDLLPGNFMKLSATEGSTLSCMDFIDAVIMVQFRMVLPSIAFMYLAITCIHDEIKNGNLYLYKDIPRIKVFSYKALSMLAWYGVYIVCTILASVFTYYVHVIKQPYASGLFFVDSIETLQNIILSSSSTILTFIISILLVIVLSTFLNNGASLVIGILFCLFCSIAPMLSTLNIFFPTGFLNTYQTIGFGRAMSFTLLISIIYLVVIGAVGRYRISRIEF